MGSQHHCRTHHRGKEPIVRTFLCASVICLLVSAGNVVSQQASPPATRPAAATTQDAESDSLTRGQALFHKLQTDGDWNCRPQDLSNLTRWLSRTFEVPLRWEVVSFDMSLAQWRVAPILYITGSKSPAFTEPQIARLRRFVLEGGTIFSCAGRRLPKRNSRGVPENVSRVPAGRTARGSPAAEGKQPQALGDHQRFAAAGGPLQPGPSQRLAIEQGRHGTRIVPICREIGGVRDGKVSD